MASRRPGRWAWRDYSLEHDTVAKAGPLTTKCRIWKWGKTTRGYGRVAEGRCGGEGYAHRWFYKTLRGEIPAQMELDHLCETPACVNPQHLEVVSHTENMRRYGKTVRKFSYQAAAAMIDAGESLAAVGAKFGVTKQAVGYAVDRATI